MPCEQWEALILDYSELDQAERARVDQHASECAGCDGLLRRLQSMDAALTRSVAAPPRMMHDVLLRTTLRRPPVLPHVLDFVAWAAVLVIAYRVAPFFI